jgi:UDP-N-acetylmuramyl tripeptide synthase
LRKKPSVHTTPDAIELQRNLAEMVANGMSAAVMEVSSYALASERVAGVELDAAVLTNITHDHFDFHHNYIHCGQPFGVMVDFAYNPAALENILKTARGYTQEKLILVFGCEGEKDRLKRPLMGKIAVQNADIPILTSDNVYHEAVRYHIPSKPSYRKFLPYYCLVKLLALHHPDISPIILDEQNIRQGIRFFLGLNRAF